VLPGRGSQGQQSRRARGAMAWWGWLASLSLPGWLIWVHGIGYSVRLQCLEQMWSRDDRLPEAQEQTICQSDGPRWSSPMRGVGLDATGFYWVTGLFCAIVFAVVMVVLARLSAGRRAQD
jgi:hypothetical protein